VVELHLIVCQLLLTVLASVVIAPNNPHHLGETQPPPSHPAFFPGLGHRFGSEENGANVTENIAFTIRENLRDALGVVIG
jgi:hypothetical protein